MTYPNTHDMDIQACIEIARMEVDAARDLALATSIIENMNDDDRATYDRDDWRDGVSNNCINGEDLDTVLDHIDAAIR